MPWEKLRWSSETVSSAILGNAVIRSYVSVLIRHGTVHCVRKTDFISAQPRHANSADVSKQPRGAEMPLAPVNHNPSHRVRHSSYSLDKTYCRHYAKPLFWGGTPIVPRKLWMIKMTVLTCQDNSWERGWRKGKNTDPPRVNEGTVKKFLGNYCTVGQKWERSILWTWLFALKMNDHLPMFDFQTWNYPTHTWIAGRT